MTNPFRDARTATTVVPEPSSSSPPLTREEVAKLDALAGHYQFRDYPAIETYLRANPDLLDLLHTTAEQIPTYFALDERPSLEMLWDPEDEGGDELFAVIPIRLGWEDALEQFNRLIREWLVDAGRFAAGRFNVALEYR